MSADGCHFGLRSGSLNTFLAVDHLKHFFFPIRSYVKTMSAEGGHLEWRSGSPDTILKIDHLRTIHAMFALNWLTGFREEDF